MREMFTRLLAIFGSERGMATLNVVTKSNVDSTVPEIWAESIEYEADRNSVSGKLAGPDGSDAAIIDARDLKKGKGDQINFTRLQRLLGKGVSGTTALEGSEEKLQANVYSVAIELYRHATAFDEIADFESVVDFNMASRRQLRDWLERRFDDDWMNRQLNTDTIKTLYAGGKTSRGNLGPGDTLLPRELRKLYTAAVRRGVAPITETRNGKTPFPVYGALLSEIDYYLLVNDSDFKQDMRLGAARGAGNPAINAAVDMYQGIMLYVFASVSPGDGMYGSYLRPEARLAAAINSSVTTFTIGPTSAVTNVDYGQYFPTSGSNTLLIGSEQITYTGGSSDPGDSSWATVARGANGTTAASHSAGDLITLNNLGKVLLFGRRSLIRGWGKKPEPIKQERDYGMEMGTGLKWFYGLKSVVNGDSVAANAVALETYAPNPSTI